MPDRSIFRDPLFSEKTTEPIDPKTALNYSEIKFSIPSTGDTYTNIDPARYRKYVGGSAYTTLGEDYLNKERAQNQSATEQFVGFLNQAVVGEIAGGTIEGIGTMLDLETYGNLLTGTEKDFGNWFSDIGKSLRTWSEEATPIYRDPDAPKFDPGAWSWWMQNGKSIASTLSLMIPSGLAIKGISSVGKLMGAFETASAATKWAAKGLTQAALSRHMENMMEASGAMKEAYDTAISKGMSPRDADEYAAKVASKTYSLDWAMFLQDVPQYMLLNRAFGKGAKKLLDQSIGAASMMGKNLLPIIGTKSAAITWDMLGEGFEEGYQYIAQKEAQYLADRELDPTISTSFDKRFNKYSQDGDLWTNVFFGAMGAGVMQTAGKGINDLLLKGNPKVDLLKQFGTTLSHAAAAVNTAEILGSESGHKSAIQNLESALFTKGMTLDMMDDVKDLINRSANPTEEDIKKFNINPSDLETIGINKDELLADANEFETRWNQNVAKWGNTNKAATLTNAEFVVDKFNKFKNEYSNRLQELQPNIANFNELSPEAQEIFNLSAKVSANKKKLVFQQRIIDNPESGKKEKKDAQFLIDRTNKKIKTLESEIDIIEKSRTPEDRAKDDDIDIGGPKNLLDIKDEKDAEKVQNHAILEYRKLSEALAWADETLTSAQQRIKDITAIKQTKKTDTQKKEVEDRANEDKQEIPEPDDVVVFTKDGNKQSGIVDTVDESGDYVIIPKVDETTYGEPVTVSKDAVELATKTTATDDANVEALDNEEIPVVHEEVTGSKVSLDISYYHGNLDEAGNFIGVPEVRNEDLNRFLSNPKNTLDGVTAEFLIDDYSEYGAKWFAANKISKSLLSLTPDVIDNVPIAIVLVKDGKVLFKGGMYYHVSTFKKSVDVDNVRRNRRLILETLISGRKAYSSNLTKSFGHFNNAPNKRGNVLERLGVKLADAKMAVSRKNGKVYKSNSDTVANLKSKTPGSIFVNTKKTSDGREIWAKVNPTKISKEHAEILWDALVTRYSYGKGGYMAPFPDDRVTGLTVGEVINMLVLFGEKKTNIDSPSFKGEKAEHLRKKTLYVHSGRELTFGSNKIDLFEDNMAVDQKNKAEFIAWATANKNYSMPIAIAPMGVELNSAFNRSFKLGSWENEVDGRTYAQFLMSRPIDGKDGKKFAVESDLMEYEDTGSVVVRPHLYLSTIEIAKSDDQKVADNKVPDTKQSKARKATVKKLKSSGTVNTAYDIINLPVGAILYFKDPVVEEGVITKKTTNMVLAQIDNDAKLGRILNLSGNRGPLTEKWHNLVLDTEGSIKDIDEFVSYLKTRPHIPKVLVDISNVAEDKVVEQVVEKPSAATEVKPVVAEEGPINTGDTLQDLEDILNAPLMEAWEGSVNSVIDMPKELKWLHNKFGKQNVEETDNLIRIASTGRLAFGVFTSDCIYIYKGAPKGVMYHEAFHRVLLGYLSPSDRQVIYESARKEYNMPNATESELSEKLAESFREYKLTGAKPKSRTIWQKFTDILAFIYTYFTGRTNLTSSDIDRLYDSIERGQFRYSKVSAENDRVLNGLEMPMAVDIRRVTVPGINNYHDLDKIVKYLTSILIQTNEIDNLNNIKTIQMSKMFDYIDKEDAAKPGLIQRLRSAVTNGTKQIESGQIAKDKLEDAKKRLHVSGNLLNILTIVNSDDYRHLFVDKISDMLVKLNVKRIVDEDAIAESFVGDDYRKFYDKASYEINSKDNILASIKFLIATLPKSAGIDANIGISEFVDFNEMWNSIMHNLWDIGNTDEMMERLSELTEQHPYRKLVEKLDADKTGIIKEQLRTSVMRHRHDFINFLVKLNRKGDVAIELSAADVSSAARRKVLEWNIFFRSAAVQKPITMAGLKVDANFVKSINAQYVALTDKINKEYSRTKVFANPDAIVTEFTDLLNRAGVKVDKLSVQELVKNRPAENDSDRLRQVIDSDFAYVFTKILDASSQDITKIFGDEKVIKKLAEAYVNTHPEEISDSILGPGGNLYYVYSQNSYITDKIRQFKFDKPFLQDHAAKTYSDGSYYMNQLLSDDKVLDEIGVKTMSMFGRGEGMDYLSVNPIEDYVFKLEAFRNGLVPFPTMADRQTYYILKGLKPYEFKYTVDGNGNLVLPESAVDIFVGYARSEKNRIDKARKLIQDYNAAKESGNKELIDQFERQLVDGYHYVARGKEKDTTKGSALQYHHFYSLNAKSKEEGFDFDRDIRGIVRDILLSNIEAELEYVTGLGIINISSFSTNTNYYNRLLDGSTVKSEIEKYGDQNKAIRNIIASNFINSTMAAIEVEKMFSGDPAFYKVGKDTGRVHEDKVKRLAVMSSTGDNFSETVPSKDLNDSTYNVVTFATRKNVKSIYYDELYDWHRDTYERQLKEAYDKEGIEKKADEILSEAKVKATNKLSKYLDLDPTDGQVWISPDMYKSLSIRLGEWSNDKDVAFDLLQAGRELTLEEEQKVLNITFQPLKLVYFDLTHEGDLAIPTYDKASFSTIFRTMTVGKYGNRQITDMLDRMELKGKYATGNLQKIDMFKMDTAVKVGNRKREYPLDDKLEEFVDLSNVEIYQQSYSGLRRQLTTDTHDVDRVKTGTQFLKIVLSNLNLDNAVYTLDGKQVTGRELSNIAFNSLRNLSTKGRQELERRLGYANGKINKAKFVEMLADDAKKSGASDNLIDALTMFGDDPYLELDSLTDHKWIQSRIVSLISKYTIDINLPGNQLIQFSNFGMRSVKTGTEIKDHVEWIREGTDDLKWMKLENGKVSAMECIVSINLFKHIIPNYDKLLFKEKVKFLADNPELMGYRIPTQGHNSIMMLKVAGVYPETIGDTITLPSEFTTLTGSDFDIDKLYATRYNYVAVGGKLEKVKFIDGDTNDEAVLKSIYKTRFGKVIGKWEWLQRVAEGENLKDVEIDQLSQMADLTDSKAVEDAILRIRTQGRYDKKALDDLTDYINSLPKEDQFIAENKAKSIYSVNSKKAVENRLLDTYFAVMRSEEHFPETSAPLGSLTDKLKKKAESIRKATETTRLDLYYASPRYNEYVKSIYGTGKEGTGPFALNNNHHVLGQLAGLKMRARFGGGMYEQDGLIDLSRKEGKDKVNILDWISALIEAHVDVAKDPYVADLNINSYTYNVVALMLRGGTGEQTFDFVAQPILKELAYESLLSDDRNNLLTKRLLIDTGEVDGDGQPVFKQAKAVDYIRSKWQKLLTEEEVKEVANITKKELFGSSLAKDLVTVSTTNKAFIKRQLAILDAFIELRDLGNDLNTLIQASQIDTKKFGSSIVSIRAFMNKIRKAYDIDRFVNIEKILPYDPNKREEIDIPDANFLGTYANNSISFALNLFSGLSIYGTDSFNELFDKLQSVTGNTYTIDEKLINVLSDELFSAIVSKFFTDEKYVGVTSTKLKVLFDTVIQTLADIKSNEGGKYDDLKDNAFLRLLYLQDSKNEILPFNMFIAIPNKSAKDKIDKDNLIDSFKELLKHDSKEVQDFARRLVYFSFFTSGFRTRIYSFFNLIPNELMREIKVKDPTNPAMMVDRSYNDMIKSTLISMKDLMNVTEYVNLVDEVIINNHDHDNIVKFIRGDGAELQYEYAGKSQTTPVAAIISSTAATRIKLGYNDAMEEVYRPYIKVEDDKLGHVLMRYIGYITGKVKDEVVTRPVYVSTNMRSYNSRGTVIREYGMDKSIIDAYNELNIVKDEKAYLEKLDKDAIKVVYVPKANQLVMTDKLIENEEQEENKEEKEGLQVNPIMTIGEVYTMTYQDSLKDTRVKIVNINKLSDNKYIVTVEDLWNKSNGIKEYELEATAEGESVYFPNLNIEDSDKYPFKPDDKNTRFSTEPQSVQDIVTEMGIIDWTVVTKEQWERLRSEYKHCKGL